MKVALIENDDRKQLVLTPEGEFEKGALDLLVPREVNTSNGLRSDIKQNAILKRGEFFPCVGGWLREGQNDDSVFVIVRKDAPPPVPIGGVVGP